MTRRSGRNIHGILLLDKPQTYSSNEVLQKVRRLFNAKKAGHTGSLDPIATGMLPICFGEATKFAKFVLNSDKRYHVIARFGQRTDTSDAYGKIILERPISFTEQQLSQALDKFRGNLIQVPSIYSAIKYQGKPLYKYARHGINIKIIGRPITIYDLQCKRWQKNELELEIHCSKGTYIRTIIDDLGELLGCSAHVIYLRRLQVGNYSSEHMITLHQLYTITQSITSKTKTSYVSSASLALAQHQHLDALLLPIDTAVNHFPEINISKMIASYFKKGQSIIVNHEFYEGHKVRVTEGSTHKFIGIAKIDKSNKIAPYRLVML